MAKYQLLENPNVSNEKEEKVIELAGRLLAFFFKNYSHFSITYWLVELLCQKESKLNYAAVAVKSICWETTFFLLLK